MPQNPATLLDSMSIEVANVLAFEAAITSSKVKCSSTSVANSLKQAKAVKGRLERWPDIIPTNWFPISVPAEGVPQSVRAAGIYGGACDIYPDIMVAILWNDWRWTRLRVLVFLARYEDDKQESATMQSLADDVCASVPFCFGDRMTMMPMFAAKNKYPSAEGQPLPRAHSQNAAAFGGWYMFTPLMETLKAAEFLRKGQVSWIRNQLQRLATIYNLGIPRPPHWDEASFESQ